MSGKTVFANKKTMIVAGVMSGTSADGINVALVRLGTTSSREALPTASVDRGRGRPRHMRQSSYAIKLLGHAEYSYPRAVRAAVLSAMNAARASVADLARLSFVLGELYADAVLATQQKFRVKADLVG